MLQPVATLEDLEDLLCGLTVHQFYVLPYTAYARLFPPGEPDQGSGIRAFTFAKNHGCVIQNRSSTQQMVFTKQTGDRSCAGGVKPKALQDESHVWTV